MSGVPPGSADAALVELQNTLYRSRNPTRRWLHCARRDWVLATLERLAPAGLGTAIEVGPGCGVYLPALASLAGRVLAVDVEAAYLDALEPLVVAHPNVQPVLDDITASTLPSGCADLVLCSEVIEHIADSQAALREIHRLLRPGGVLVLTTPQRYSPLELTARVALLPGFIDVVRLVYREPVLPTGHINLLTVAQLRRQLVSAGFVPEEIHRSGVYLPLVAEFGGRAGLRVARHLERMFARSRLAGLLWIQYHVARKPAT